MVHPQSTPRASASEGIKWFKGKALPVKPWESSGQWSQRELSHQGLLCPGGTNLLCEVTPQKGLKQWPTWPPLDGEKTAQHLLHTHKLQPWTTWLHSLPQLFRGAEGKHRVNPQSCTFITVRILWCGRKASVPAVLGTEDPPWALKSLQDSSQQITDPEQSFTSGEREFGRTRLHVGRGLRGHFQPTQRVTHTLPGLSWKGLERWVWFSFQTPAFQTAPTKAFPIPQSNISNLNQPISLQQTHTCALKAAHLKPKEYDRHSHLHISPLPTKDLLKNLSSLTQGTSRFNFSWLFSSAQLLH